MARLDAEDRCRCRFGPYLFGKPIRHAVMGRLQEQRAIIHGGAGAIGSAIARAFIDEGARVFLTGRDRGRVEAVAAELGPRATAAQLDVLALGAVEAHAEEVARGGGIDVVVNAIGVDHVQGVMLGQLTLEAFWLPVERYVRASFTVAKAVSRHMMARRRGVIVTLSAPGGRLVGRGWLGHGAAFAAVEQMTRLLAAELGPSGVRAVCLCPDAIPEALARGSHTRQVFGRVAEAMGTTVEALVEERARTAPFTGRLPTLAEVAAAAVFVASTEGGAVSGTVVNLTAGARPE
jgi:NAD(P)-dependent dehydrogenase (short-subunit alcohol dehydrogenase family)